MALIAPGGRPGPSAPSDQVTSDQVQGLWLIYDWQSDSDPRYLYTFWPPGFPEYCSVIGREDGSARSGISADPELLIGQPESPVGGAIFGQRIRTGKCNTTHKSPGKKH